MKLSNIHNGFLPWLLSGIFTLYLMAGCCDCDKKTPPGHPVPDIVAEKKDDTTHDATEKANQNVLEKKQNLSPADEDPVTYLPIEFPIQQMKTMWATKFCFLLMTLEPDGKGGFNNLFVSAIDECDLQGDIPAERVLRTIKLKPQGDAEEARVEAEWVNRLFVKRDVLKGWFSGKDPNYQSFVLRPANIVARDENNEEKTYATYDVYIDGKFKGKLDPTPPGHGIHIASKKK